MSPVDFTAIMKLKKTAMKRCEERILEAASRSTDHQKKNEDSPDQYGVTQSVKKKHGL
jgi:hypothetical protein